MAFKPGVHGSKGKLPNQVGSLLLLEKRINEYPCVLFFARVARLEPSL